MYSVHEINGLFEIWHNGKWIDDAVSAREAREAWESIDRRRKQDEFDAEEDARLSDCEARPWQD